MMNLRAHAVSKAQAARRRGGTAGRVVRVACAPVAAMVLFRAQAASAQRVLGLDTSSAANTSAPSLAAWQNAFNDADGDGQAYKFAFVRSNNGLTTDDSQFYTNISRATTAGLLAGSYNFAQPSTNTATVEANHYLDRAGMYMKPGYLLPVFDLESGNTMSTTDLTNWSNAYMDVIFAAKGIYPIVYTNSSYNNDEVSASVAWTNTGTTPKTGPKTYQWLARPSGNLVSGDPLPSTSAPGYPNPYGVWDPNYITRTNSRDPAVKPWAFWQNGSGSPNGFLIDKDAANGNIEFVKDFLVPALWTNAGSGDWGTIANWNSDNPLFDGTDAGGPAPRLPNNSTLDWVKLQNSGNGTVTISSGAQTVRKFYTQQPLDITGGSLSVSYIPGSGGQFDVPSEFKAAVTLSSGAAYSAHTTVVDGGGGTFNLNGGTVTFTDMQLASNASNAGKINLGGNVTFAQTTSSAASIIRSTGTLAQAGSVVLLSGGGTPTFNVNNGSAAVDLQVRTTISGSGRLTKAGAGTMHLAASNSYSGGTSVTGGVLQVTADNRLGAAPVTAQLTNIILDGGTLRTGAKVESISLSNPGSGYTSFPALAINGGGGNLLAASANVLAGISSIAVSNGGSGYVNQSSTPAANSAGTFVDIVGGGGSGAAAFATVVGGIVTGITLTNPGSGYTSIPTIHISSTGVGSPAIAGTGAAANVATIVLQSIALADGGFDYTTPTISFSGGGGGSGAVATATSTPTWTLSSNRGIQLGGGGGTLYQTGGTTLSYGGVISGSGALTKSGPGTLALSGASTYTGATTVNAGKLNLLNNLTTSSSLTLSGGATVELTTGGGSNRVIDTGILSVTGAGTKLDLQDNKLITTSAVGSFNGSAYDGVTGLIASGRNGGAWNGNGIITGQSTAATGNFTTLAIATAQEARNLANPTDTTLFAGQTVTGSDTLVMYTYGGDANLDGKINVDDYGRIDFNVNLGTSGWFNGDFSYDGKINVDDYGIIDFNVGIQGAPFFTAGSSSPPAGLASVPEPGAAGVLIWMASIPIARRRRRVHWRREGKTSQ